MPELVNAAMNKVIGIPVRYNRVPGGLYPRMVSSGVDWAFIQWSLDTYDWRGISSGLVMSKVRSKLRDGDIILCHDIKPNTAESARRIARYAAEQGYMLLTIDELFASTAAVSDQRIDALPWEDDGRVRIAVFEGKRLCPKEIFECPDGEEMVLLIRHEDGRHAMPFGAVKPTKKG
jgi:hypothetical protein